MSSTISAGLFAVLVMFGLASAGCALQLDFDQPIRGEDTHMPPLTFDTHQAEDVAEVTPDREVSDDDPDLITDHDGDQDGDQDGEVDLEPLPQICGNGVVEPGEACDDHGDVGGDGCSDTCQLEDGYACAGAPSICGLAPDLIAAERSPDGPLDLRRHIHPPRTWPDIVVHRVLGFEGEDRVELGWSEAGEGFAVGDELLFMVLHSDAAVMEQEVVGRYGLAVVTTIGSSYVRIDRPLPHLAAVDLSSSVVVAQRVPRYHDVVVDGTTLTVSPFSALDGRGSGEEPLSTGVLALRAAGRIVVGPTGTVDVSGIGLYGGKVGESGPLVPYGAWAGEAQDGASGTVGQGPTPGGAGGGRPEATRGGDGTCGCNGGQGGLGHAGGGGSGSSCPGNSCACAPASGPCAEMVHSSGGGGGAPPSWDDAVLGRATSPDFGRIGPSAGGAQGGGGGASAAVPTSQTCAPAEGGRAFGAGGAASPCGGEPGTAGLSGQPGGGVIWLKATEIEVLDRGRILADGGSGGTGGQGAGGIDTAAGGGGAGGTGGTGGTIVLEASSLLLSDGALSALGGAGGDGGAGGGPFGGDGGVGGAMRDSTSRRLGLDAGNAEDIGSGGGGRGGDQGWPGSVFLRFDTLNSLPYPATSAASPWDAPLVERTLPYASTVELR